MHINGRLISTLITCISKPAFNCSETTRPLAFQLSMALPSPRTFIPSTTKPQALLVLLVHSGASRHLLLDLPTRVLQPLPIGADDWQPLTTLNNRVPTLMISAILYEVLLHHYQHHHRDNPAPARSR